MNKADAKHIITELMKPLYGCTETLCQHSRCGRFDTGNCLKAFRALTLRDDIVDARKFV